MPPTETLITLHHIDRCARREGLALPLPTPIEDLTPAELQERRVPLSVLHALWATAVTELGDRAFPLKTTEYPAEDARSAIAYACAAQKTVGTGLDAVVHYWRAANDDLLWTVEHTPDAMTLVARAADPGLGARCAHEFHVTDLVRSARRVTGGSWAPREVRFSHAPGVPVSVYEDVLGVPVRFRAPRVEIIVDRSTLDTPLARPTPAAYAPFFRAWADTLLARHARRPSLEERVREAIARQLDVGEPSLADVARHVAMSERSLHRHLAAAGASFRELLDATRRARAMELLDDDDSTVVSIASALGFSDGRAFARAFKRWTGRTPRAARDSSRALALGAEHERRRNRTA